MLEKPDVPDELIISRLLQEYDLRATGLTFLPIGADTGTAVYRVAADDGLAYFLKLRKGFEEITVTVPLFLKSQGLREIIPPIETKFRHGWADFGEYRMILYPFIEGKDGFERELTDAHRRALGAALNGIHAAALPSALKTLIPAETFDPEWRERLGAFQALVEHKSFDDPAAAQLAGFMRSRRDEIDRLIGRAARLASELRSRPFVPALCHTDIHGGNILISDSDELYIVDWDNPLLAPRERDLMFIGGGIDGIWQSERDIAVFYEGYGQIEIDRTALAYYRYERIVEDLAAFAGQLLLSDEGGADREQAYRWFTSNFEPGGTVEIAERTFRFLMMNTA